ncbi:MAG: transporter substrate-binding domain-containing protein [Victivallaceae bacterium]|nr:transporter substrate-binding domain-containing protein [Victivallaceae bacterium]
MKCVLFIFALIFGLPAAAATPDHEQKVVRIGYYADNNGFQSGFSDTERKSGYAYEYYQDIARLTGWQYEYVYGTWGDIYAKLLTGDVDIMAGVSRTPERDGKMLFPNSVMGTESYYVFVPADDDGENGNAAALTGKKIGVNTDSLMLKLFSKYVKENNVDCTILTYDGYDSCAKALRDREIDGLVITDNFLAEGIKPILKIGASDIYFAIAPTRHDLLDELNTAQEQLFSASPYYNSHLQSKYFDRSILRRVLTDGERRWLAGRKALTIGYINDNLPYCDTDAASGRPVGVIVTLQQELANFLQLPVHARSFNDSQAMLNALHNDNIDIAFPFYSDPWIAEQNGLSISSAVVSSRVIALYNGEYNPAFLNRIAVTRNNMFQTPYLQQYYPNSAISYCHDRQESIAALQSGLVTGIIGDSNLMLRSLNDRTPDADLRSAYLDNPISWSLAVRRGNAVLQSIIDKTLVGIDRAKLTESVIRNSYPAAEYDLTNFITHNPVPAVALLTGVLVAILIVFVCYLKNSIESRRKLTLANAKLSNYQRQTGETLSGARTGLWSIEMEDGNPPRMFGDATMHELLGLPPDVSPESCYSAWQSGIAPGNIEEINRCVQKIIASGRAEITYPWHHPKRGTIYVRLGGVSSGANSENIVRIRGYHQDITETVFIKLKMEEAIKESAAKSSFLSSMSHEIRTPLNAVIGFSELLETSDLPEAERNEYLHGINVSGKALLCLINDILDLSKLEAEQMKYQAAPCDIKALISEVSQVFTLNLREKNLGLCAVVPDDLPLMTIDEQRLRQVIFNLLGNAVKFTDAGSITITVFYEELNATTGRLTIKVSDTGCGISDEFIKNMFQPFSQADTTRDAYRLKGTGLGLAISKRLVNGMGGELRVESRLGKGSTFIIEFPQIAATAPTGGRPAACTTPSIKAGRILIVDDVPLNLKVLAAILKKCGVATIQAGSGREALDILARERQNIDMVMTDLWMPDMNGIALAEKIKADPQCRELPVIAVSADIELRKSAGTEIFAGIVYKPISVDGLMKFFSRLEKTAN